MVKLVDVIGIRIGVWGVGLEECGRMRTDSVVVVALRPGWDARWTVDGGGWVDGVDGR